MSLEIINEITSLWKFLASPDTVQFIFITGGLALVWLLAAAGQSEEV